MPILELTRDWGINPSMIRMVSDDTYAVIISPGYLDSAADNGFVFVETDVILAAFDGGEALFTIDFSGGTLTPIPFIGVPIPLPISLGGTSATNKINATQNLGLPTGQTAPILLGDFNATNPPQFLYRITPAFANQKFLLPPANAVNSMQVGNFFLTTNVGSDFRFDIYDSDGITQRKSVFPNEIYACTLLNNATANGSWLITPYIDIINNLVNLNSVIPLNNKEANFFATTSNLNATYNNGVSGIGATLTSNVNGVLTVDGGNPSVGMRVLVKDQVTLFENGYYDVVDTGSVGTPFILRRTRDYNPVDDAGNTIGMIRPGDTTTIAFGATNQGSIWMQTNFVVDVGVDPIQFLNINPSTTANSPEQTVYVSQDGSNITGNGTIEKPFATISFALTQITDNAFLKPYTIFCSSGLLNDTNIVLKPFVSINLQNALLNLTGSVTLDPSWNFLSANLVSCYINNGTINSTGFNLDLSLFPSNRVLIAFFDVSFNVVPIFTASGNNMVNPQIISMTNCGDINNLMTITYTNIEAQFTNSLLSNINVNVTLNSNNIVVNSIFLTGNYVITASPFATLNTFVFGSIPFNPISINGAGATLFIDSSSFISIPIGTDPTNYNLVSLSNGLNANYTPANYTPADTSVHGHLVGIDNALFPVIAVPNPENIIIGGDMSSNPWQRGTNFLAVAVGTFTADRFEWLQSGVGLVDINKLADAPTPVESGVVTNDSLNITVALVDVVGPATFYAEGYKIEGFDWAKISQKPLVLSFWAKSSQAGTYCIGLQNFGQDRSYVAEYIIGLANTWTYITIPVTVAPTAGTWNYTNNAGLRIFFTLSAGANLQTTPGTWQVGNFIATASQTQWITTLANTFQIDLVQLTAGTATYPFIYQTQADILNRCMRYYEKSYDTLVAPATNTTVGTFNSSNSSALAGDFDFDVRFSNVKRATPNNVIIYSVAGNAANVTQNDATEVAAVAAAVGASSFRVQGTNAALKYGAIGHYTVDAEI